MPPVNSPSLTSDVEARIILLSGEHLTLPESELRALLAVHDPDARVERTGPVAIIHPGNAAKTDAALARMALAHEWGIHWGAASDDAAGVQHLAGIVTARSPGTGSAAVVATRRAGKKGIARTEIERALGTALQAAGHTIDLGAPNLTASVWLLEGKLILSQRRGVLDRSSHEDRTSDDRAHFSPVSLHPRRAASLLHLARVPLGGRVLDPFCGTGAFVLEAALEGYATLGSDLDRFMVQGTMTTVTDAGPEPLDALVFKADIGVVPDLLEPVDGIVADFPYGRASSSHDEGLADLYNRAFAAFAKLLPIGGHAVIGVAQEELLPEMAQHGFEVVERHTERMHKSLTRVFIVAKRTR